MVPAPLPDSGVLSPELREIRQNRTLFILEGSLSKLALPNEMWRDETQPGDMVDKRDEQCTAQSRPGMQPEFLGADDYECSGATLHYTICQVPIFGIRK